MNHITIRRLRNHHRWLEQQIYLAQQRVCPDAYEIQALKRQKLQVKDELFLAEAGLQIDQGELQTA